MKPWICACLWLALGTSSLLAQAPAPNAGKDAPAPDVSAATSIPSNVEVVKDVPFCTGGGHPLLLDMYLPRNPISRSMPAVLWIHGGGWRIGGKSNSRVAAELAARGFVGASAEYRLSGEAPFPAAIEDTKCAVRYLRANAQKYGIDPDRIGVAGSSAGAHLALLIGTAPASAGLEGRGGWDGVPSRVQAVLSWFGPADFSVGPTAFERGKGPSIIAFLGGTPKQNPANYRNASPVTWVAKGDPPLLMFHGDEDTTVPHDQSVRMEAAYRKAGLDVELVTVKYAGHGFKQAGNRPISPSFPEILEKSLAFFQDKLGSQPSPSAAKQ
jgi:acetyl esterase/lipase